MAMIDMTHRKLRFPPRFIPYLERHRIFELFHECVEMLVQERPKDHIRFLKDNLRCAAKRKDKQRIVFISPVTFDRETFSELLAECLGIRVLNMMKLETLARNKLVEDVVQIQAMSESITSEEESCICPGEHGESPASSFYYPPGSEMGFMYDHGIDNDQGLMGEQDMIELGETDRECKEGKGEEGEGKEPCICVCPCKKKLEEEERERQRLERERLRKEELERLKRRSKLKRGGIDEGEGGEGDGNWDYYPCPPVERKKKTHKTPKKELPQWMSPISSGSSVEIDFGVLNDCEIITEGWILEDFPVSGAEAENLNYIGVIPTHALRIIVNEEEEENNRNYKMTLKGWMKAYEYVPVMEIRVNGRSLSDLVKDLCSLLSLMPHRHAPMLPRIVLIGSRGSGVTTQAQKLALKYRLVHVEYDIVMKRALEEDEELCKLYKVQKATRPDPELEAVLLERALVTKACCNRGWVLTGYPKDADQMRMLDIMATPPNRVIFLDVPARECFVRLYYRKMDSCLGDEYKLPLILPSGLDSYETPDLDPEIASRLMTHPMNNKKQIIRDIEEYFLRKNDMKFYCGKNASHVNGDQEVDRVFEQIEQVIIHPSPPQPPRDPLFVDHGIEDSYERLKKFRLARGLFFNNLLLNPPENRIL